MYCGVQGRKMGCFCIMTKRYHYRLKIDQRSVSHLSSLILSVVCSGLYATRSSEKTSSPFFLLAMRSFFGRKRFALAACSVLAVHTILGHWSEQNLHGTPPRILSDFYSVTVDWPLGSQCPATGLASRSWEQMVTMLPPYAKSSVFPAGGDLCYVSGTLPV